ncbi:hypothetical protein L6R50_08510 [Myxococcota bacterium]|nr:hypothetical protein [Myxococcota bacterium]
MGWLKELLQPGESFDALGRRLVAADGWPNADMNPRSVGNELRKLDRGDHSEWWFGTNPARGAALARLLEMEAADLEERLREVLDAQGQPRPTLVPLDDLPAARPIDLASESLFPGIPPELTGFLGPFGATWWIAPTGAGVTLLGRWLAARRSARVVVAPDARAAREAIRLGEWVYVDLESDEGIDALRFESLPEDAWITVAAPFAPPGRSPQGRTGSFRLRAGRDRDEDAADGDDGAGWSVVETPPLRSWIAAFLKWVERRLPRDGGFSRRRAEEVATNPYLGLRTPGDVLALCGVLDEVPWEAFEETPEKALRMTLKATFARVPQEALHGEWMRREGPSLARTMLRRLLTSPDVPTDAARSFVDEGLTPDEWSGLVPTEAAPGEDREEVDRFLARAEERSGHVPVEGLRAALRPDGREVVRLMVAGRWLGRCSGGRYRIRHGWLAAWLLRDELARCGEWRAEEIGEAFLRPGWNAPVVLALEQALHGNPAHPVLERILDAADGAGLADVSVVAAVEAGFRAAGLAVLDGARVDPALRGRLVRAQGRFMDLAGGAPPRLLPLLGSYSDTERSAGFGSFVVASLALTEGLDGAALGALPRVFAPWCDADPSLDLLEALRGVRLYEGGKSGEPGTLAPWARGSFRLGARLERRWGKAAAIPNALVGAAQVFAVSRFAAAALDGGGMAQVPDPWVLLGLPPTELIAECEELGCTRDQTLAALWRGGWDDVGGTYLNAWLRPGDPEEAATLWRACPPSRLSSPAPHGELRSLLHRGLPLADLDDEAWGHVLAAMRADTGLVLHRALWEAMPIPILAEAFLDPVLGSAADGVQDALVSAWHHDPGSMTGLLRAVAANGPEGRLGRLLATAPTAVVLDLAPRLVEELPGTREAVRRRLGTVVADRDAGWREAWRIWSALAKPLAPAGAATDG